jgi:hypothetical protein
MKSVKTLILSSLIVVVAACLVMADNSGRIYGKLTTVDGDVFEGLIRWDKNEGSWVDILNGNRELPRSSRRRYRKKYGERKKKITILGIPIRYSKSYSYSSGSAQSGIRFGHIEMLEVIDDDAVLLTLKSGETVEFENYSTDIGESIRELVIEDRDEGEIEFDWDDLDRIEFMQADTGPESNFGDRLYGTLTTRRGDEFTGWVCWDVDELFTRDILDGKEKRRKRKIDFGKIESIERRNSNSAVVTLKNGDEFRLRGTNDVDDSNRGIIISDEGFGQVVVEWDEFDRLDFKEPKHAVRYDDFDGGHRLEGTVYTEDGERYKGTIRWDDDEEYTWEILDGNHDDNEYDIEFTYIREIKRKGHRSSVVTIWDGRSFKLRGSNDVDDDNKGIYITLDNGDEVEVEWDEFDRVEFVRK